MSKTYRGRRLHNGTEVTVVEDGKEVRLLRCFGYHSPDGFEWGYGGSGPSELALAILLDYFGELPTRSDLYVGATKAQEYHQRFKWAFIAPLDKLEWEITSDQVEAFLHPEKELFGADVVVSPEESNDA